MGFIACKYASLQVHNQSFPKMNTHLFSLLLLTHAAALEAQDFAGIYNGAYNGDPVVLVLSATGTNTYAGTLNDNNLTYEITARSTGKNLKGICAEKSLNLTMELTGVLNGTALSLNLTLMGAVIAVELKKAGATPAAPAATAAKAGLPAGAGHDPALVGRWTHQSNYNSGYGQGSMSSENVMIFYADGRLADGGSRTVTGGSDWSGTSSGAGSGVVEGVVWYTKGQQLFLQSTTDGKTETQLLGHYFIENNNMLITGQDGTKVLFYKG